jgi:hypothetical protein
MQNEKTTKEIFLFDLIKAQSQTVAIIKKAENTFFAKGNNKAKYAKLSDILSNIKPILNTNHLFLYYSTEKLNEVDYVVAKIIHENGEFIECKVPIKIKNEADKNDPQKYGSAFTYAKRYSISALMALAESDEEDDDGNDAAGNNRVVKTQKPKILNYNQIQESYETFREKIVSCETMEDLEQLRKDWTKEIAYFSKEQKEELGRIAQEAKTLIEGNYQ